MSEVFSALPAKIDMRSWRAVFLRQLSFLYDDDDDDAGCLRISTTEQNCREWPWTILQTQWWNAKLMRDFWFF